MRLGVLLEWFSEPATDANGRNGRDVGNEDVRIGWGLVDDGARVREREASGDDTNFDESKWEVVAGTSNTSANEAVATA